MSKDEVEEKRSIVACRYDSAPKIVGMSTLHSFTFHTEGVVEAAKCRGATKVVINFPLDLVDTIEEVIKFLLCS
jgi:hypothetical protein